MTHFNFHWLAERLGAVRPARQPRTPRAPPRRFRPRFEGLEERRMLAGFIAVGTDVGVPAEVRIFADRDDNDTYETFVGGATPQPTIFSPFPGFDGGVRVAMGDFDEDGNDELVTAAGPGGGPHVIIWDLNSDGTIGGVIDSFMAFDDFSGGVFVAAGQLNLGGDELVVAADAGGGPHVKIFSDTDGDGQLGDNLTDQFFAFSSFSGGVRLAFGNIFSTSIFGGSDELICAAGPGGGPHVVVFTDADLDGQVSDAAPIDSFFAYPASFSGGVYVAATSIFGMGHLGNELITGQGAGGNSEVRIFSDGNGNGMVSDEALVDSFPAYGAFGGGVRVAAGDTNNTRETDEIFEIGEVLTAPGPGGGPHITIRNDNGDDGVLISDNPAADQFFAFASSYTAGVFVAFGAVLSASATDGFLLRPLFDGATSTSRIFVPAEVGIIRDLDVSIAAYAVPNEDLDVTLTHVASGTSLVLFTDVAGTRRGFFVRLDDASPRDIGEVSATGTDAVFGVFNPEGPALVNVVNPAALLSTFNGLDASGMWLLTIVDDTDRGDQNGLLSNWSLHFRF